VTSDDDRRSPGDWLAQNMYLVTGGLALFCIVAVGLIALSDQLLGTERWCYVWLGRDGDEQSVCRDSARSCTFDRQRRCDQAPEAAASPCHPHGDEAPQLERCAP